MKVNTSFKQDDADLRLRTSDGGTTSQDGDVFAHTTSTVRYDLARKSNEGTAEAYTDTQNGAASSTKTYQIPPQKIN